MSEFVKKGSEFGQKRGKCDQKEVLDNLSRFAGVHPPHVVAKRRDNVALSCVAALLVPIPYPKKKTKRRACSAWAAGVLPARQNWNLGTLGQSRARSVGVFSLYVKRPKNPGIYPPLTISLFFSLHGQVLVGWSKSQLLMTDYNLTG